MMKTYEYGNIDADIVLIQPVDDHDLSGMETEITALREQAKKDFRLIAVKVENWNQDLSPWKAPAVFGKEDFGDGAAAFLDGVLELCKDADKTYYIGGYSLAGLFALWAACQTDVFSGAAAASPSVWFPGFSEFFKTEQPKCGYIYLSLGDREEKARNPMMAAVGDRIRELHGWLEAQDYHCVLEWNQGNHFKDADLRTAKAFAWVLNNDGRGE